MRGPYSVQIQRKLLNTQRSPVDLAAGRQPAYVRWRRHDGHNFHRGRCRPIINLIEFYTNHVAPTHRSSGETPLVITPSWIPSKSFALLDVARARAGFRRLSDRRAVSLGTSAQVNDAVELRGPPKSHNCGSKILVHSSIVCPLLIAGSTTPFTTKVGEK